MEGGPDYSYSFPLYHHEIAQFIVILNLNKETMRPGNLLLWIVLGIVVILVFIGCGSYNNLVGKDENVKKVWNDVQTQ
jgi:hypothetical protein